MQIPWEYVAVFDADFEMPPDFLYQTIWHMQHDAKLGFVQTRWSFTNGYDNMLCWYAATECLGWPAVCLQLSNSQP